MAVKIRLARRGRKKRAMYDVVIADARAPRDGRFIEKIGTYNPNIDPAAINIDNDKAFDWIMKGAQPTDTVKAMLSYRGVMFRKHLQIGVIKGALTQEQADAKLAEWVAAKEAKISGKVESLSKAQADAKKAKLDAETKVKEARAEALAARLAEEEAANAPAEEEAEAEGATEVAEGEEAPAAEASEEKTEE
ncbi:MAG: 30S ribosomal protein S16 [Roseivirga sp.]|nr:30S ribosomal protein S16 [Roseivirga sp.]